MKKYDKEIIQLQLEHEKEVIEELKKMYKEAEKQIDEKIQMLMADELTQSKIYQIEYQKALKGQIGTILDNMNSNNYDSIQSYLKNSYEDGYIGTMYSLQQQGIPLVMPIDQEQVVKAIQLDSKLSGTLYEAMGVNTNELKKSIRNEVSRGISNAYSYQDIARNINNSMGIGLNKSIRIARTEGHRVNQQSTYDAMDKAKKKGANVVKQWDATLDAKTRPSHQRVDGEIRELDETFSNGLRFPGDPQGSAAEVINCRCVLLQRARWALDDDELKTLQERANYFGLDKTDSFNDYKAKYLQVSESMNYSSSKARKELSNADTSNIKKADETTSNVYSKIFNGYDPSPLNIGSVSEMNIDRIPNNDGTYKYVRSVSNVATSPGNDHVDIGNPALANSLHERAHDVVTQIAMKRAGITDENHVTVIQDKLFHDEKQKIQEGVYLYCFKDETFEEIEEIVANEISERATYNGHELISEGFVEYLGKDESSELSKKVYNYLVKEWKKR